MMAWSIECSSNGIAPSVGARGEPFPKNKYRYHMAGKQLAKGYKSPAFITGFFHNTDSFDVFSFCKCKFLG